MKTPAVNKTWCRGFRVIWMPNRDRVGRTLTTPIFIIRWCVHQFNSDKSRRSYFVSDRKAAREYLKKGYRAGQIFEIYGRLLPDNPAHISERINQLKAWMEKTNTKKKNQDG